MERLLNHSIRKFSVRERRLAFMAPGNPEAKQPTPEAQKVAPKVGPTEGEGKPEAKVNTPKETGAVAGAAVEAVAGKGAAAEARLNDVDKGIAAAEEGAEKEKAAPKTHLEAAVRSISDAKTELKDANEAARAAQQEMKEAGDDPVKKEAAQAKIDAAKEKGLQATIKMIAAVVDIISRLFNGTLNKDPNAKEEDKDAKNGATEKPGAQSNTPQELVRNAIQSGNARNAEQIRSTLSTQRNEAAEKIKNNNERIGELRDRNTQLKTQETSLRGQRDTIKAKLDSAKGTEKGGEDTKILEAQLKEAEANLEATVKEIASNETLIQSLVDDNEEQQNKMLGIDRAITEIVTPLTDASNSIREATGGKEAPQFINNGNIIINFGDGLFGNIAKALGLQPDEKGDASVGQPPEEKSEKPEEPKAPDAPVNPAGKTLPNPSSIPDIPTPASPEKVQGPAKPAQVEKVQGPAKVERATTVETASVSSPESREKDSANQQIDKAYKETLAVLTERQSKAIGKNNEITTAANKENFLSSALRWGREKIGTQTSVEEQARGNDLDGELARGKAMNLRSQYEAAQTPEQKIAAVNGIRAEIGLPAVNVELPVERLAGSPGESVEDARNQLGTKGPDQAIV